MLYIEKQKIVHYSAKSSAIFFHTLLFTFKPSCCILVSASLEVANKILTTVMAYQLMITLTQLTVTTFIYMHMYIIIWSFVSGFTKFLHVITYYV